uniref:NADH-ubiquinone oxidoreductase chain 6 n=1 Tax=Anastrangalia sequensi TaxID=763898 RepID=A0A343ERF8_9CUCU|nr:NADH dehydrogenase subunit 6 [Anastrangalia sequensi]ASL05664.1 NADH dehydrogenase subunit 6 [Anastrangalia sequensi]
MLCMKILLFSMSITFLFLNHPLTLGSVLLVQTILISIITGLLTYNFWFSYILFLIMIGGMLILFIYMTSIASNEKFKFSYKLFLMMMIMLTLMFLANMIDSYFNYINLNIQDLNTMIMLKPYNLSMTKFMNWPNNMIIFMMITYLLITLIAVVKITKIQYGPLRQKN